MNQELLDKIEARRAALEGSKYEKKSTQPKVQKIEPKSQGMSDDFKQRQKLLEANLFKKTEETVQAPVKKQEIKGNKEGFNDARKMLEAQMSGNKPAASSGNTAKNPGLPNLPPPPSNLPPPPPPSLNNLPPPPPPSLNTNLPPPPPLNNILPPPPPLNSDSGKQTQNKTNLPPEQPKTTKKEQKVQSTLPPPPFQDPQKSKKSKSPLRNMPQPNFSSQKKPEPTRTPSPQRSEIARQSVRQSHKPQQVPKSQVLHPRESIKQPKSNITPMTVPREEYRREEPKQRQTLNQQGHRSQKKKIFDTAHGNVEPISSNFFEKDVAGFLKRQFIKDTNILGYIGEPTKKMNSNFHFPSIIKGHRDISRKQTLYVDKDSLNLVGVFMVKNLDVLKSHNQSRQEFLDLLKNYDMEKDPKKMHLKAIRQLVEDVPNLRYSEPNLVKISHALKKCDELIDQKKQLELFEACKEIKNLRDETKKLAEQYCKYPEDNSDSLEKLDRNISRIRSLQEQ